MRKDYLPIRESLFDEFVHNFDFRLSEDSLVVGVTADQAALFHTKTLAWDAAYAITKVRATRCTSAVIVKNEAKSDLTSYLRTLARIINAFPETTNELRSLFGLTVPGLRHSRPAPASAPLLRVIGMTGNEVEMELRDSTNPERVKPANARSATFFTHVGDAPPAEMAEWIFCTGTTRSRVTVRFDPTLPAGTTAWVTAFFKNERDQSGPACAPVRVTLMGGGVLPGNLKKGEGDDLSIAA